MQGAKPLTVLLYMGTIPMISTLSYSVFLTDINSKGSCKHDKRKHSTDNINFMSLVSLYDSSLNKTA